MTRKVYRIEAQRGEENDATAAAAEEELKLEAKKV